MPSQMRIYPKYAVNFEAIITKSVKTGRKIEYYLRQTSIYTFFSIFAARTTFSFK